MIKRKEKNKRQSAWDKFHLWKREYEKEYFKKLTPIEKLKILDDLYIYAIKIKEIIKK